MALAAFFEEQGQIAGLLDAISEAAQWDQQFSEGKSLSEREEAVLQALEIMTRNAENTVWLRSAELRSRVAELMGQTEQQMGDVQWIGHILKRLHLVDKSRRKRLADGICYAADRDEVCDVMRRYDVTSINNASSK